MLLAEHADSGTNDPSRPLPRWYIGPIKWYYRLMTKIMHELETEETRMLYGAPRCPWCDASLVVCTTHWTCPKCKARGPDCTSSKQVLTELKLNCCLYCGHSFFYISHAIWRFWPFKRKP